MAGDQRELGVWEFPVDHVQIGPAHRASMDSQEDLFRLRLGYRRLGRAQRVAWGLQDHRAHRHHLRSRIAYGTTAAHIMTFLPSASEPLSSPADRRKGTGPLLFSSFTLTISSILRWESTR